ncbi:hypothetical protein [Myxosarcina sp. GI1(2024)]
MSTKKRKPRNKTKFTDGETFIHPNISYKLSEKRKLLIDLVNHYIRSGLAYKDIAKAIGYSEATVVRLYYGYADNCLSSNQIKELKALGAEITLTETVSRIASKGEVSDRKAIMPVVTNMSLYYFEKHELTESMPLPFEIRTIKYIPRSPGRDFGKLENEAYEEVNVIDTQRSYRKIRPYVVMYLGACCTI